jgi:MAP/microtubule affinity-regulating kinase
METRGGTMMPRTIKFASNCTSITYMAPELFFQKVKQALEKNEVDWAVDGYLFLGDWGDIKFELEICKLPKMKSFGLRFKRLVGDIWEFKRFSGKLQSLIEGGS